MSKKTLVWVVAAVAIISLASLVIFSNKSHAPNVIVVRNSGASSQQKLSDIQVTYELSADSQRLYSVQVSASTNDGQAVLVNGKACNTMNSTISILPKGQTIDKKVIKTLNDGRQVLEPMTMSTLMACELTTPKTDDAALNSVINNIAASLQSY